MTRIDEVKTPGQDFDMINISLSDLDISSLSPPPTVRQKAPTAVVSTDWEWMIDQAAAGGHDVKKSLADWNYGRTLKLGAKRWQKLLEEMKGFVHKRLYTVTPEEVFLAIKNTEPPFGGTRGQDQKAGDVSNATSAAPFNLMLHKLLETLDRVPTWQDFEAYHKRHPSVYLQDIAYHAGVDVEILMGDWLAHPVGRAVRYRLATSYNSFIRELHFRAAMEKEHGVFLTHHFLLDALWKIDFLYDKTAIELYLENSTYKGEDGGRKIRCVDLNPRRDILLVTFGIRRDASTYDRPWLLEDATISSAARRLRSREVDHRRLPEFYA